MRSLIPGDVHRGIFDQGDVRAVCGLTFFPIRVGGQRHAHCCRLPESGQACPKCMTQAPNQAAISAVCSRHPEKVISLVVSDIGRGASPWSRYPCVVGACSRCPPLWCLTCSGDGWRVSRDVWSMGGSTRVEC